MRVNGRPVSVAAGSETAIEVIRDQLGLTGTKFVCGTGVCGACTVAVDGVCVTSCVLPAEDLEGADVITVEGIADDGTRGSALSDKDGAPRANNSEERGRLILLAARARKSHFQFSPEFGGYLLENLRGLIRPHTIISHIVHFTYLPSLEQRLIGNQD